MAICSLLEILHQMETLGKDENRRNKHSKLLEATVKRTIQKKKKKGWMKRVCILQLLKLSRVELSLYIRLAAPVAFMNWYVVPNFRSLVSKCSCSKRTLSFYLTLLPSLSTLRAWFFFVCAHAHRQFFVIIAIYAKCGSIMALS